MKGEYCVKCNTVWCEPGKCNCYEGIITKEMVGIKNEREELLIKLWWNEAIEEAAKSIDEVGSKKYTIEAFNYHKQLAEQIRKLKK